MNPLSDCLGHLEKKLVWKRQGERYHQSCVMPTVKHPETIHVWGCFSAKGVGSLTILPKNTVMNKEWYQHILWEQLLPTIQEQFGDEQCIFQHDGAPCHKAKVITKWRRTKHRYFGSMARKLPRPQSHWELVFNPQEEVGQTKPHKFWQTPSIDYARMGCHQNQLPCGPEVNWQHASADCRGLEKEGSTLQILNLHQLHVIVNKSLWHLWNACNYTSVSHSNIWQKYLKTLKQQTLWKLMCHSQNFWPRL